MNIKILHGITALAVTAFAFTWSAALAQSVKIEQVADYSNSRVKAFVKLATISDEAFRVTYVVVAPNQRIDLALPRGENSPGVPLNQFFLTEKSVAVLNGGYLRTTVPATPSGLLQVGGNEISPLIEVADDPVLSGVVCFAEGRPAEILPVQIFKEIRKSFSDCVQAGPLIAFKGQLVEDLENFDYKNPDLKRFSSRPSERSFVLRTIRDETILGVTERASLSALRAVMLASEKEGGFGAVSAITLTGRSSAGLIIGGEKEPILSGGINLLLPNAIVVRQ
jgi:hypothetical protein